MFNLVDTPRPAKPQRGSPQLFKSPWVDKYFSRIRPWHVLALWAPVTLYLCYRALHQGARILPAIGVLLAGVLTWTLIEYLLHRFVFHYEPGDKKWKQELMFLIHGIHHDYPWDADRLVMPPSVSALIAVILWFPTQWIVPGALHNAYFAGIIAGYVWYDLGHYAWHNLKPRTALGRYLRSYHLIHHFKTPNTRYGVSTPLWDYVFGTAPSEASDANARSVTLSTTKP